MEGERLTNKVEALRVEDRWRRERPRPKWEDSVKRYLAEVGGEWRMRDRGSEDGSETGRVTKKEYKNQCPLTVPYYIYPVLHGLRATTSDKCLKANRQKRRQGY